ncbi:MAG: cell division protein FtsZ [Alphaproteobacteria bacterium]|nr:cell division protein FtsZ [Alphaproteobacteria bacterium]
MNIKLELPQLTDLKPRLTVIGVGGAGCNAVNNMIAAGLTGVEFVVANTDAQTLEVSSAEHRIQLGINLTEGLGAGANPEIGAAAAEEAIDEIKSQISGSHMLFLAAGMGGGTGTGAISIIARASREMGILTVGVVTKPFQFEGSRRMRMAEAGIAELRQNVDTLIVIPNQNLFRVANEKTTFAEAFLLADQVLYSGVACIVDLIVREGLINLDFADVRAVMRNMGTAMMGTGEGTGERRAITAAEEAIANPLLDDVSLQGAKGLLLSITGGPDLTLYEVDEAASRVRKEVDPEANIIVGATFDDTMEDRVRVSIVASGMSGIDTFGTATSGPSRLQGLDAIRHGVRQMPPSPHLPTPPPVPGAPKASWTSLEPQAGPAQIPSSTPAGARKINAPWPETDQTRPQTQPGQRGAQSDDARTPNAIPDNTSPIWRSAEGVTIEAGSDALKPHPAPASSMPNAAARGTSENTFRPQQTEEIHRRTRRMPEVEDFPAVGQRDYYAKRDPQAQGAHEEQAGRQPSRKQGFFERLTGRGRKPIDSPPTEETGRNQPVDQRNPQADPFARGGHQRTAQSSNQDPADGSQDVALPVFFSTDQGRR